MSEPKDLPDMGAVSAKVVENLTGALAIVDTIVRCCQNRIDHVRQTYPTAEVRDIIVQEAFGVTYHEGIGWGLDDGCCCPMGAAIFELDPAPLNRRGFNVTEYEDVLDPNVDYYSTAANALGMSRDWAVGFAAEVDRSDNTADRPDIRAGRAAAKLVLERLGLRP